MSQLRELQEEHRRLQKMYTPKPNSAPAYHR